MNKDNRTEQVIGTSNLPNSSSSLEAYELDDNKICQKVLRDLTNDKQAREEWEQRRELIYKRYRQVPVRKEPFEGASNIVVGVLQQNIDSLLPRLNNAFLAKEPPIVVVPTEENDKQQAKVTEKFFNKYMKDHLNYEDVIDEMNIHAVLYGTAFLLDYFEDGVVKLAVLDPNDVYLPFNATCELNEMSHVSYRIFRDRWWVSKRFNVPIDKLGTYKVEPEGTYKNATEIEGRKNRDDDIDNPIELNVWFGRWIIQGEIKDIVCVVAVKEELLLAKWFLNEVVPYAQDERRLPINRVRMKKVPGCAYGVGLGEDLSGMHDWTNSVINAILDGNYWSIIPWGTKVEGSKLNVADIKVKFGMILNVPTQDAITFRNMPNMTAPMVELLPYIQAQAERVGGIADYSMNRASESVAQKTATGINAVSNEMGVRLDGYIGKAAKDIRYTLDNVFKWIQVTVDEFEVMRTLGGATDPKDVQLILSTDPLKYDISININYGYASRETETKTNLDVYQLAIGNPQLASNPEFMKELTRSILESVGKDNLADLLDAGGVEKKKQLKEIAAMTQGEDAEVLETDDHMAHVNTIDQYLGSEAFEKSSDVAKGKIQVHRDQHLQTLEMLKQSLLMQAQQNTMAEMAGMPPAMPQAPQGAPMEQGMPPQEQQMPMQMGQANAVA